MKTVYLLLPVSFDPSKTVVEAVSCAVDALLNTAMSMPGVLSDYGPVVIGDTELLDPVIKKYREAKEAYFAACDEDDGGSDEYDAVEELAVAVADTIEDMAG